MNSTWKKYSLANIEHQKTYLISTLSIIIIIIVVFIILSIYSEPHYVELYLNTLTVLAAGVSFWASLKALKKQKWILYDLLKASWFYISVGIGLWLTAETIWLAYIIFLGEPLKLSIADLAWVLGYVFVFAGLYIGVKPLSSIVKSVNLSYKTKIVYAVPLVIGAILIGTTLAAIPSALAEEHLLTVIVDTSYIILDLILFTLSLEIVISFYGGKVAKGHIFFSTGLALRAISDLPYFAIGGYYPGNILDLLYVISYIVIASGIYVCSRQSPII